MKIRFAIFLLPIALGVAACSNSAEVAKQQQECNDQFRKSKVELVTCLNRTEAAQRDTAVRRERQQFTLDLARQVDGGELSQKEADRRFTLYSIELLRKHNAMWLMPSDVSRNFQFPKDSGSMSPELAELIASQQRTPQIR